MDQVKLDYRLCDVSIAFLAAILAGFRLIGQSRLLLLANVTSLEIQVTSLLVPYATSAFAAHSLVSTIYVVQSIVSGKFKLFQKVHILTCLSCHQASHRQGRRCLRPPGSFYHHHISLHHRLYPASCISQCPDLCQRTDLLGSWLQRPSSPAANLRR